MMAYRSTEHETTSSSPNFMMLGRETTTPLDIQYSMPRNLKAIPQNTWAWELKEKMEDAHQLVREHVKGQMLRQKQLHDKKLSWQSFKPGDDVFVFFPNVKPGQSPKLACRWKGPFRIISKLSDVTYQVRCGNKRKIQVIHADRIKPRKAQVLRHEKMQDFASVKDQQTQVDDGDFESKKEGDVQSNDYVEDVLAKRETKHEREPQTIGVDNTVAPYRQSHRARKAPAKHSDYISY